MICARVTSILTILIAASVGDITGQTAPSFFEGVVGSWQGEGQLFGSPAEFQMDWEWELDQTFVRLTYVIRGATTMDAIAHYRLHDTESLAGIWLDTRGEFLELSATLTDTVLETIWRSPTEKGRTVYQLTGPDSLEVRDYYDDGGDWKLFGQASYSRAPDETGLVESHD